MRWLLLSFVVLFSLASDSPEPSPAPTRPDSQTEKPTPDTPRPTQSSPTEQTSRPTDKPQPTTSPNHQNPTPRPTESSPTEDKTPEPTNRQTPTIETPRPTQSSPTEDKTPEPTNRQTPTIETPRPTQSSPTEETWKPTPRTEQPSDKPSEPTAQTSRPTDKPGNPTARPTPATRFPTERAPTKGDTFRPTPERTPTKPLSPTRPTKPLAPTRFSVVFPGVTTVLIRTDVLLNVTNGTCNDVRNLANKTRFELVRILGVSPNAVTVEADNCDAGARRLLTTNTLIITTETTFDEAEGVQVIAEEFILSPAFAEAAASSAVGLGSSVEVTSTTQGTGCGLTFQAFADACNCPFNMTELSDCPDICAEAGATSCKASLQALANCTTDIGLGSLVTKVRARFGECDEGVNSAVQVSVGMLSLLAWLNI